MKKKTRILFLCSGNSTRSQMAEGFARHMGNDILEAFSAGISPLNLNPLAVKVMQEAGVDISGQSSDPLEGNLLEWADMVITLCGSADEQCPVLPPGVEKRHWPLPDPTVAGGTEDDVIDAHRSVRDRIHELVRSLVQEVRAGGS